MQLRPAALMHTRSGQRELPFQCLTSSQSCGLNRIELLVLLIFYCQVMQVFAEGGAPHGACPKVLKTKAWLDVVAQLRAQGGKPTHDGSTLVTSKGACTLDTTIPDGASIS